MQVEAKVGSGIICYSERKKYFEYLHRCQFDCIESDQDVEEMFVISCVSVKEMYQKNM